jgi:hypothetical protein
LRDQPRRPTRTSSSGSFPGAQARRSPCRLRCRRAGRRSGGRPEER